MDSGGGQILQQNLNNEPFKRSSILSRSPEKNIGSTSGLQINQRKFSIPQMYLPDKPVEASYLLFQEKHNRTENEQILYGEWKKVVDENKQQNIVILKLSQQMEELRKEMMIMKQKNNVVQEASGKDTIIEYHTDEEELAKETKWVRVKNRRNPKKRRLNNTPSPPQIHAQHQESVPITEIQPKVKKSPPPPPIIVEGIEKYDEFYDTITQNNSELSINTKLLNSNSIKINVQNDEAYRSITKILREREMKYHSYENKQIRPIRVMVKNLNLLPEPFLQPGKNNG